MPAAKDFAELIGMWPPEGKRTSIRTFSDDTGIAYDHACMMKQRNYIAPEYWPEVIEGASKRRLGYTTDQLVDMARLVKAQRRKRVRSKRKAIPTSVVAA